MSDQLIRRLDQNHAIEDITTYLDTLNHDERITELKSLSKKHLKKLYEISRGGIDIDVMVPADYPPLKEVIFYGHNSLPMNRSFQKRMCRGSDGLNLLGYNHQPLMWASGPGYYVASGHSEKPGEVMIDYTKVPYEKPEAWPKIKSNETGIGYLVYGGMKDFVRQSSREVFIAEASKKAKNIDQYFVLCRTPF